MNMTRTREGNVFQAIIFAMVTTIAKMVQMNNLTYVVSVKTFGISMYKNFIYVYNIVNKLQALL